MAQGIITLGRFEAAEAVTPLFDDTACREVSSLLGVLPALLPVIPLFDDTRCHGVSSL